MLCENCKKEEATVHYKEIIDDKVKEVYLCKRCAEKEGMILSGSFGMISLPGSVGNFLAHLAEDIIFLPKEKEVSTTACSFCGTTYSDLKEKGKLGCPACYQTFNKQLTNILRRIHGSSQHIGSSPAKAPISSLQQKRELMQLKEELQVAIKTENFEKAAQLRDKIRELEKNLKINEKKDNNK